VRLERLGVWHVVLELLGRELLHHVAVVFELAAVAEVEVECLFELGIFL